MAVHDAVSLPRINVEFLPVLSTLVANDHDAHVRAEAVRVVCSVFLLYSGVNGVVAVNIVIGALLDVDDVVQLAAIKGW